MRCPFIISGLSVAYGRTLLAQRQATKGQEHAGRRLLRVGAGGRTFYDGGFFGANHSVTLYTLGSLTLNRTAAAIRTCRDTVYTAKAHLRGRSIRPDSQDSQEGVRRSSRSAAGFRTIASAQHQIRK
ncbi:uncharacterized protein EV422DRAFT_56730 [Fimicolochytrium jonesii]|uniref:uncharacterized protein n=1 Tax=Fimicolochytrium jonesii TaxID=1396493 RepID=UPI0022FDEC97|nr:uncharacterized protein EV422DRAFT_56730 [Fimicolochytrium jonesii]KAI8821173.1 hypothetical protein EV422DRAFT_56730 [Fimicolochytrium jonesii]